MQSVHPSAILKSGTAFQHNYETRGVFLSYTADSAYSAPCPLCPEHTVKILTNHIKEVLNREISGTK